MSFPEPTKRRLVLLERLLSNCGQDTITSGQISSLTGWSPAIIRKDISLLGVRCGASNGYRTESLVAAVRSQLFPAQEAMRCCIVGLGRMGQTLLSAEELYGSSFTLVAGFDSSLNRTEVLHSAFPLHPTTKLEQVVRAEDIRYAILTDADEAQSLASRLSSCGIRGIVNYTPHVLPVPPGVAVENVSLLTALETLSARTEGSGQPVP